MTTTLHKPRGWNGPGITCVVMSGGRSSRFETNGMRHKSMAVLDGKPLLHYVVDYWRAFTDDFLFVVKHGKEQVIDYARSLPIRSRFVEPLQLRGIADGLSYAEPMVGERFIVVLGDCFLEGTISFPESFEAGIVVQRVGDPAVVKRNYAVHVSGGRVARLEEKPQAPSTDLCGLGFYFLTRETFDAIRRTPPAGRTGEIEITDVLGTLVSGGASLVPLELDGHYVNVTVQDDLLTVHDLLGLGEPE